MMQVVARLHAISREMLMIAAEYQQAAFFALKPEKDGLRMLYYMP